jgi:hypothetical protein
LRLVEGFLGLMLPFEGLFIGLPCRRLCIRDVVIESLILAVVLFGR